MKVLVTGAAGRVGPWVARELVSAGHELRLLYHLHPLEGLPGEHIQGDITDWETVQRAVDGVEGVAHLAMLHPTVASEMPRHVYYEREMMVDVLGTDFLLRAALEAGVKRFVYTSSTSVYEKIFPQRGERLEESAQPLPQSHYGMCKLLAEEVCRCYAQSHGLSCVVLRFNKVTFPDQWQKVKDQDSQETPSRRVHVLDVARAVRLALEKEGLKWEVFRVSGDNPDGRWPIDHTRKVLGFEPEYGFDVGQMFRRGEPVEAV